MRKRNIIVMLIMTVLANFNLLAKTSISGPSYNQPLEIYSIWNPVSEPRFTLYTDTSNIDYNQSTIQYETADYDLSISNSTEDFSLYVYSNYYLNGYGYGNWSRRYRLFQLNIYHSSQFVPVEYDEFIEGNYPEIDIYYNPTITTGNSGYYSYVYEITNAQGQSSSLTYDSKIVDALKYSYYIVLSSGYHSLDLIDFNFSWTGYTGATRYWDMEGYVLVELESV